MIFLEGPRQFAVDVVGEARYQDNLRAICGPRTEEGENRIVDAALFLETDNFYDPVAVRVDVDRSTVGYLSRDAARGFRALLANAGYEDTVYHCRANIRGGWQRGDHVGHYGVWLDLPTSLPKTATTPEHRQRRLGRTLPWVVVIAFSGCAACVLFGLLLQACGA